VKSLLYGTIIIFDSIISLIIRLQNYWSLFVALALLAFIISIWPLTLLVWSVLHLLNNARCGPEAIYIISFMKKRDIATTKNEVYKELPYLILQFQSFFYSLGLKLLDLPSKSKINTIFNSPELLYIVSLN